MINPLVIITILIILIVFKMYRIPKEVDIIIMGLLLGSMCFYIALNMDNVYISRAFMVASFVALLMIPILLMIEYFKKISK